MWTLLLQPKVASHLLCPQPWLFAKGKEEGSKEGGSHVDKPSCIICGAQSKMKMQHFPRGPVVKNPPSNAGAVGSIPGPGAKILRAVGQLSPPCMGLAVLSPCVLEPMLHNEKPCATSKDSAAKKRKKEKRS